MIRTFVHRGWRSVLGAWLCLNALFALANDNPPLPDRLDELRAQAVRQAIDEIAPSVVQIETIGGDERVEGRRIGVGPTTGVVVREDGLIVTSTFNFVHQPSTILVALPDGQRYAARRIANDTSRMLTLLKVEGAGPLVIARPAPLGDVRVGQSAVALGRPFEAGQLVQARGIVSALGRVSGKAVQTDARVSPHHYGGPLIDLWGRALGIIVPLSPMESGAMAGADWYDSGIGFAIPLEHVLAVLPRWAEGKDLVPGVIGVRLASRDPLESPVKLADVRPGSPARRAGMRTGDAVLSVGDQATTRVGQFQAALARRYAGESVSIVVRRHDAEIAAEVELVESVPAYRHPQLGILPAWETQPAGVSVAEVLPGGSAERAGMLPGDVIVALAGQKVSDRAALETALADYVAGETCVVEWRRGDESGKADVTLTAASLELAADAAPRRVLVAAAVEQALPTGPLKTGDAAQPDRDDLYVPESFAPGAGYGLLVLLDTSDAAADSPEQEAWRELCRAQRLVVLSPAPAREGAWSAADVAPLREAMETVRQRYGLISSRSAICAEGKAAQVAAILVFGGEVVPVRGLATYGVPPLVPRRENEPSVRIWLHTLHTPAADPVKRREAEHALDERGYWATSGDAPAGVGLLDNTVRESLGRWLAGLDRL